jgi:ubiquinone/menaquinone biosynthesis C-methylase UbiE
MSSSELAYGDHGRPFNDDEARDVATYLGVPAASIRAYHRGGKWDPTEGSTYDSIVSDPIKSLIAPRSEFFAEVKLDVMNRLVRSFFPGRPRAQLSVVDVGCGTGAMMRKMAPGFGEVLGCDPALAMVRRCGGSAHHMTEAMSIPFESDRFDVAVCACVYHHIEPSDRLQHLQEIRRVLRPGGVVMIFEHNPINPVTRLIVNRCPIDATANLLSGEQARALATRAGFSKVSNSYYLFMPQFLYRLAGRLESLLSLTRMGGQFCTAGRKPSAHPIC